MSRPKRGILFSTVFILTDNSSYSDSILCPYFYEVCQSVRDVSHPDSRSSCSFAPQPQTDIDLFCLPLSCAMDLLETCAISNLYSTACQLTSDCHKYQTIRMRHFITFHCFSNVFQDKDNVIYYLYSESHLILLCQWVD